MTADELLTSLKSFYKQMLQNGYKLHEIDQMDYQFYYSLFEPENERRFYIDEVW